MTVGNNVKTLVILIPNEGHHAAGEDNEARFLDQHFVPENAIVNTGTTIGWFNGDVGHDRTIDVKDTDGSSTLFNTGEITDMQLSQTFVFNEPGVYNYEAEGDPGVTMTGTITVADDLASSPSANSADNSTIDTAGVLMVPTQDIDSYVQDIQNAGLTIDSMYDFNDLRGGQKGTGDVQTLIVWTSQSNALDTIIPPISELSSSLPYS
jgi:plastocyanin